MMVGQRVSKQSRYNGFGQVVEGSVSGVHMGESRRQTRMFWAFVQRLLVLFCLTDTLRVLLELLGCMKGRTAVDTCYRSIATVIMLVELGLLDCVGATCMRQGRLNEQACIHPRREVVPSHLNQEPLGEIYIHKLN
jgi:hypothetical protein